MINISNNNNSTFIALETTKQLLFIDSNVEDYKYLAAGVVPGTEVIILDSWQDGVNQITKTLQKYSNLASIHIVSHGSPGCLYLGNTQLNLDTLEYYAQDLQTWFAPSLLLYGCNVAAGDAGAEFITKLHQLTKAKIAASNTLTGSAALGGNWELEIRQGEVSPVLAFHPVVMANYSATLALSVTQNNDATSLLNILQGNTEGLSNFSATITSGASSSFGEFTDEDNGAYIGMDAGIVLTTGDAAGDNSVVVGPNDSVDTSVNTGSGNGGIPGANDFTELEITFESDGTASQIYFQYVFGSEEFPEFGGSNFNDGFELILNSQSIGKLSDGVSDVTINNLLPNGQGNPSNVYMATASPDYIDNPEGSTNNETQLDGYTKVLTAIGNLQAGTNTLKIRIYDIIDGLLDSAVLIKAESISTFPPGSATSITADEESTGNSLGLGAPSDAISFIDTNNLTITVTAVPTLGSIKKADGTTVQVNDTLTEAELQALQYDAPDEYNGTDNPGSFTYNVDDGSVNFNGKTEITLNAVNDNPVVSSNNLTIDEESSDTSLGRPLHRWER